MAGHSRAAQLLKIIRENFSNLQPGRDVLSNVGELLRGKTEGGVYEADFQLYVVGSVYSWTRRRRVCQHALH